MNLEKIYPLKMSSPPHVCACVVRLLSTFDLSSDQRKIMALYWYFQASDKANYKLPDLRGPLPRVAPVVHCICQRESEEFDRQPYYGDSKRISVILSFPNTRQLFTYSSDPDLLINIVATHHRLERVGLILTYSFDFHCFSHVVRRRVWLMQTRTGRPGRMQYSLVPRPYLLRARGRVWERDYMQYKI